MGEETSRLRLLTNKLSDMENWITIKEVIEEFEEATQKYIKLRDRITYTQLNVALGKLLEQWERAYRLLKQEHRNITENLNDKLTEKINFSLLPQVEKIFKENKGEINKRNTDCKLIATALACAKDMPTYVFSHDRLLLKTFANCATKLNLPIKETYVIKESEKRIISTKEYYKRRF